VERKQRVERSALKMKQQSQKALGQERDQLAENEKPTTQPNEESVRSIPSEPVIQATESTSVQDNLVQASKQPEQQVGEFIVANEGDVQQQPDSVYSEPTLESTQQQQPDSVHSEPTLESTQQQHSPVSGQPVPVEEAILFRAEEEVILFRAEEEAILFLAEEEVILFRAEEEVILFRAEEPTEGETDLAPVTFATDKLQQQQQDEVQPVENKEAEAMDVERIVEPQEPVVEMVVEQANPEQEAATEAEQGMEAC
jgi:hypothetical protein